MEAQRKVSPQFLLLIFLSIVFVGCVSLKRAVVPRANIDFIGERITLKESYPAQIKNLNLNISLPEQYELLSKAGPEIRLFTREEFIQGFEIVSTRNTFELDETITTDYLYAELSLFYCRDGNQGLCINKQVLYKIPINDQLPASNLDLEYIVEDINGF